MGQIRIPENVYLVSAVCFREDMVLQNVFDILEAKYGRISYTSEKIKFEHTTYYSEEMGETLYKQYVVFERYIDPALLPDVKHLTNALEEQFSDNGKRTVNIDPGYIELAKLVLASTKNFSHRIYIGNGIYGDVQLYWQHGRFVSNPWTYPDYKDPRVLGFFENIRNLYWQHLKQMK